MAVTTDRQTIESAPAADAPQLRHGDRLTRAEFHRRYLLHPEIKKAELIEGVVFLPSPRTVVSHGVRDFEVTTWLGLYRARTPGLLCARNATVLLDARNEVQPDVQLLVRPSFGGQARITADDYVEGAPELVVEIAGSSSDKDLGAKLRAYERNGVRDYIVVVTGEPRVIWFVLEGGAFRELSAEPDGILRSRVFPGLWLDPVALLAGDLASVLATAELALASDEHAAFVATLTGVGQGVG